MDSLIFDLDGTLWDSRAQVGEAWNLTLARICPGRPALTLAEITPLFGRTMVAIAQFLFPQLPAERQLELARQLYQEEVAYVAAHPGALYPRVAETLSELGQRLPLFIVSNCQKGYIEAFLASTGLAGLFQGWLCYGDTSRDKDFTLRKLMDDRGLSAPVYVGDTQGDADSCARAGIPMVWASYGFGTVDRPWRTLASFAQPPRLLDSLD